MTVMFREGLCSVLHPIISTSFPLYLKTGPSMTYMQGVPREFLYSFGYLSPYSQWFCQLSLPTRWSILCHKFPLFRLLWSEMTQSVRTLSEHLSAVSDKQRWQMEEMHHTQGGFNALKQRKTITDHWKLEEMVTHLDKKQLKLIKAELVKKDKELSFALEKMEN